MKLHITNIYGLNDTAGMTQHEVADIAMQMGFHEMGIYSHLPIEEQHDLIQRMDGIIPAVEQGDVVIFQYPSWNYMRFDETLVNHLHLYGAKVIIFIEDLVTPMFKAPIENMEYIIRTTLNKADLLIVPSEKMLTYLRSHGLNVKNIMFQTLWEHPVKQQVGSIGFERKLFFTGNPNRFTWLKAYDEITPIMLYAKDRMEFHAGVHYQGFKSSDKLIQEFYTGGFGLIWPDEDDENAYYRMIQPHKLAEYLSVGMPVIIEDKLVDAPLIKKYGLGLTAASLKEASDIVQSISEDEYRDVVNNCKNFAELVRNGFFTRKLLTDAVINVMTGTSINFAE